MLTVLALIEFGFRAAGIDKPRVAWVPPSPAPAPAKGQYEIANHLGDYPVIQNQNPTCQNDPTLDKWHYWPPKTSDNDVWHWQPNIQFQGVAKKSDGSTAITWNVTSDSLGRRKTPGKSLGKQHAIFFGCSYTLGEGLNDDQTLPYHATIQDEQFKAYNLGVSGGSIAESIPLVERSHFLDEINESNGIAIFTFIAAHLERFCGDWRLVGTWLNNRSALKKTPEGDYTSDGLWKDTHPLYAKASAFLDPSYFLKWVNPKFCHLNGNIIEEYALALNSLRKLYWKKFGEHNRFVVVLYPNGQQTDEGYLAPQAMKKYLDQLKIEYIDYSSRSLASMTEELTCIPSDNHPNGEANRILGGMIRQDLLLPMENETAATTKTQ